MPVHKIPAGSIHEDLIAIERDGEEIALVERASRNYFIVVTRFPALQTRPAHPYDALTHAARVGAMETRAEWDREPLLHSFLTDDVVRDA